MSAFASVFVCYCISVPRVAVYMLDIAVMFIALHVLLHDCCCMGDVVSGVMLRACHHMLVCHCLGFYWCSNK